MTVAALLLLAACTASDSTDDSGGGGVTPRDFSDCDPISYDYCALPFPSSFYLREDESAPTGVRVHLGPTTLPPTAQGLQPQPTLWNERDGFSPLAQLLAYFPDMTLDGVPGHDDIGASIADGAPIVILDVETGERHPYFAELDVSGMVVPGRNFLLIRPVTPFQYGHRYVVGIRDIRDASGATIAASEGFAALRDGTPTDNWDIEGRRDLYDEVFGVLEQDGWSRSELQLAWDFTVASKEGITGKATFIRDDGLARIPDGPVYTIDSVVDDYSEHIFRRIDGQMTVPRYTEADEPGTLLTRDEANMPYYAGETTVPFLVLIPRTAATNPRPLPVLQYGHGLLGHHDEADAGYLAEMADRYGFIIVAVSWTGMKEEDADAITLMIVESIDRFGMIPERSQQGFFEFAAALKMVRSNLADDAVMMLPDPKTGEPVSVVDRETAYYYGNSQGGILGGAYLALQPEIERGVLGVPGMPYSLLLSRSYDFEPFFILFQAVYPDQRDISLWMVLMQMLWDSGEPSGYARVMNQEPLDGVAHQVLIQDAIGDAQVTTLGAHVMARAYGAGNIAPLEDRWGIPEIPSGTVGSALAEYEWGAPPVPYENVPPDAEYDTHEETRRSFEAQEQLWTFLTTGEVVSYCDGACDPD